MKKKLATLIAAGFAAGAAQGADLVAVYRDAVGFDAQFNSAKAQLEASRERLPQGRSALLPTVTATASTTWNDLEQTSRAEPPVHSSAQFNSHNWTVQLTQPLFRLQNWATYNQGELAVVQAEAQFLQASYDLMVRVAQAYFDVLLAQETLAVNQAQKTAIAEQLESAKRNFEVGTATITDTHEAQARYDLASALELAAASDLNVKRQALRAIVGKEPDVLKPLKTGVQIMPPQPNDIGKWAESAETGNAVVQQAQANVEIATQEVAKQRAGHYPTVDLVASRSHNGQTGALRTSPLVTGAGADSNSNTIAIQVSIPILGGSGFGAGYMASKNREAVALREKALADLEHSRRQAVLAARQAYLGVTSGLAQVKAYEAAVTSSQAAVESNKLGYEVGVRINIDVLNAQSQLFDTRQKLAKARFDTLLAQLRLKSAAGNLSETDLAAVNSLLD